MDLIKSDTEATADFVETVVNVMNEEKVGSVLKHFPGYGNNSDTHTGIAYDNRSISTFNASDFVPFDGVVITDDLAMEGVKQFAGIRKSP